MTGFTFVDKMRGCLLAFNIKVESSSLFTFNASRSYKLLYSVYARKPSQIHERNLRIIYVAVCTMYGSMQYVCIRGLRFRSTKTKTRGLSFRTTKTKTLY